MGGRQTHIQNTELHSAPYENSDCSIGNSQSRNNHIIPLVNRDAITATMIGTMMFFIFCLRIQIRSRIPLSVI